MSEISEPSPSATILMLRDGPTGLETFMVVRHHQIDFASGALVFPGGKIDVGDYEVTDFCDGVTNTDKTKVALMAGAIREAFEECGILMARENGSENLISGERLTDIHHYRDPLNRGEISLLDFLKTENLRLACDKLQHFAHWITPEMMPKRFDTRFYIAIAPDGHEGLHDGTESVDSIWINPKDALNDCYERKRNIIFPTRLNLEKLSQSKSVDEAINNAKKDNNDKRNKK